MNEINIVGKTIEEVLKNLDIQFPGIKFRFIDEQDHIRKHMNIFLNNTQVEEISITVKDQDELFIIQALSGG
nr:MoaD/ThiS family protein [Candidatus Prometheoarchaeum syntrophicum]